MSGNSYRLNFLFAMSYLISTPFFSKAKAVIHTLFLALSIASSPRPTWYFGMSLNKPFNGIGISVNPSEVPLIILSILPCHNDNDLIPTKYKLLSSTKSIDTGYEVEYEVE